MATTDDRDQRTLVDHARYCSRCGHLAGDGAFCPGCGSPIETTASAPQSPPPPLTSATEPPKRAHRSKTVLIAAAGALGLVAIAVAAIIILTSGSGSSSNGSTQAVVVYRQKLTAALTPVLAANQNLTSALQGIDGSKASLNAAGNAASQASSAIIAAKGAVAVLTVPSSNTTLSQQVQQALTQETGYLGAVSSALQAPAGGSVPQLRTLVTNAQSSLVPIAVVAAGTGTSLGGTDNLIAWANGAAAAAKAKANKPKPQSNSGGSSGNGSSSSGSSGGGGSALAGSRDCGGGIFAGPNTSCPFAINVHDAWMAAPGINNTLQVYSPVTNQTYLITCSQAGVGIACSGGNNASVSW